MPEIRLSRRRILRPLTHFFAPGRRASVPMATALVVIVVVGVCVVVVGGVVVPPPPPPPVVAGAGRLSTALLAS